MRVIFMGKGGSGKTTLSAGYSRFLAENDENVLAVDADLNVNLPETLGIEKKPVALGHSYSKLARKLEPKRDTEIVVNTLPPSEETNFVRVGESGLLDQLGVQKDGVNVLAVGTFDENDIGKTCYHGKLESLELLMHRLLDEEEDRVILDATAGVDNLGNSMAVIGDLIVFAVEPTEKSVKVFKDFKEKSEELDIEVVAIGNKIRDERDREYLEEELEELFAFVEYSDSIRRFEQGDKDALNDFVKENRDVFQKLEEKISVVEKDWEGYLEKLKDMHEKSSESWWNDYLGQDLTAYNETDFSYSEVI